MKGVDLTDVGDSVLGMIEMGIRALVMKEAWLTFDMMSRLAMTYYLVWLIVGCNLS